MPPNSTGAEPVRTLPGTRWSCRSCGACCRGFSFGPVAPEIVSGLESRDIAAHWAPAASAPWVSRQRGPDGEEALFFTHRDGHCVFLQDDDLCAIHARFGAEAKPAFCREYPFHVVQDALGLAVGVRADCGGLHHSFEDGEEVEAQVADILALPQTHPRRTFAPDRVVVLPNAAVGAGDWATLEPILLRELSEQNRSPEAAVAHLRARLHYFVNRTAPAADPGRYVHALRAVFQLLQHTLGQVAPASTHGGYLEQFTLESAGVITRTTERIDGVLPPLTEGGATYLGVVLRTELFLKRFTAVGGVPFGLGLFLVSCTAARLGHAARHTAPMDAATLGPVVSRFKRLCANREVLATLARARPALADLFLHAPE